jgi:biotin synthase
LFRAADRVRQEKMGNEVHLRGIVEFSKSSALFARLRPGRTLTERLDSLRRLKELGYEVGSGNMVGLPGQTVKDLVADIRLFKDWDFDMIGIGPFIPHPSTPLAGSPPGDLHRSLKILAVTLLVTGDTHLPATTASGVLDPQGRKKALLAGANVVMPDITPLKYRQHYEIYPGKTQSQGGIEPLILLINSLGGSSAGERVTAGPSPGTKGENRRQGPMLF